MDPLLEPTALEAVARLLDGAFPDALPPVASADPGTVCAAYWRARGQRDVINHLRGLAAQPQE